LVAENNEIIAISDNWQKHTRRIKARGIPRRDYIIYKDLDGTYKKIDGHYTFSKNVFNNIIKKAKNEQANKNT
jgi:Mor family transcriptional regulator